MKIIFKYFKFLFYGILLIFIFQGCAFNREVIIKRSKIECAEFGFVEGTQPYGNCVMRLFENAKREHTEALDSLSSSLEENRKNYEDSQRRIYENSLNSFKRPPSNTIHCSTMSMGGGFSTTDCY